MWEMKPFTILLTINYSTQICTVNFIQSSKTRKIKCTNIEKEEIFSLFVDMINI